LPQLIKHQEKYTGYDHDMKRVNGTFRITSRIGFVPAERHLEAQKRSSRGQVRG
jgi:hypothetical protein